MVSQAAGQEVNCSLAKAEDINRALAYIGIGYIPVIVGGNLLVIISFAVFKCLRTPQNMFLFSLAVADLVVGLITIPLYVSFFLDSGPLYHNYHACMALFASTVLGCGGSMLNLLLIIVDRFISIQYPFLYCKILRRRNVRVAIVSIWMYILILSSLPSMGWNKWNQNEKCGFPQSLPKAYIIWVANSVGSFTMVAFGVMYLKIVLTVRQQRYKICTVCTMSRDQKLCLKKIKSFRLTSFIFFFFLVLWTPFFVFLPIVYVPEQLPGDVLHLITNCFLFLGFINSMVNPIIYACTRKLFRHAYLLLLTTWPCQWTRLNHTLLLVGDTSESQALKSFTSEHISFVGQGIMSPGLERVSSVGHGTISPARERRSSVGQGSISPARERGSSVGLGIMSPAIERAFQALTEVDDLSIADSVEQRRSSSYGHKPVTFDPSLPDK